MCILYREKIEKTIRQSPRYEAKEGSAMNESFAFLLELQCVSSNNYDMIIRNDKIYYLVGGVIMYFVDRNKINDTLQHMDQLLEVFNERSEWTETIVEQLALERLTHVVIESIIDVGNAMIDGFIMRDPGSYEDIIDIMDDEEVITDDMVEPLKAVVALRKEIVQQFTNMNHLAMYTAMQKSMPALQNWSKRVNYYLENELGPVSAFLPEDHAE